MSSPYDCFAGIQLNTFTLWPKLLLLLVILLHDPSSSASGSNGQALFQPFDVITHRAMGRATLLQILGLKSLPRPMGRSKIPPFMHSVFKKQSVGGSNVGNDTIRSFHPNGEFIFRDDVLISMSEACFFRENVWCWLTRGQCFFTSSKPLWIVEGLLLHPCFHSKCWMRQRCQLNGARVSKELRWARLEAHDERHLVDLMYKKNRKKLFLSLSYSSILSFYFPVKFYLFAEFLYEAWEILLQLFWLDLETGLQLSASSPNCFPVLSLARFHPKLTI